MRDKAGQVYSAVGGILAGAGSGAVVSGATTAFAGWAAPIGIGCGFATAAGIYMMLAAMVDWPLLGRRTTLAVVIADAKALSGEIYVWMAERDRDRNAQFFEPIGEPGDREGFRRRGDRSMRQFAETMAGWNARFAVRALFSYKQLLAHGAEDASQDGGRAFVNAVNLFGVEDIARSLGVMAGTLEAKKMTRQ
jgi:hypothetical protein